MEAIMKNSRLIVIFALVATATFIVAQRCGSGDDPAYSAAAETTLSGTIDQVKTQDAICHSTTHIVVKTKEGTIEVVLGPTRFLSNQNFELKTGDPVQVVGAKTNAPYGEVFVARQVKSGGKDLTFRDAQGVPVWPRTINQCPH
jgi:hypothetical protein